MSDLDFLNEDKEKHSNNYRRNMVAKRLRDTGDHKGAFAIKVIDGRKKQYKREKLNPRQITGEDYE